MLRKINPLNWLAKALDAADARFEKYSERLNYQGRHWATA